MRLTLRRRFFREHFALEMLNDPLLPVQHFLDIGVFRKIGQEIRRGLPECSDRVGHIHLTLFRGQGFDLHGDVSGVRVRGDANVLRGMALPLYGQNDPNRFSGGVLRLKDGVATELNRAGKDGLRIPSFHPFALAFRTKEWKSLLGIAWQYEAPGASNPLGAWLRSNGIHHYPPILSCR